MMTFLNLTFLWGLPLLAVPIAIHLLSRRRREVVKWGAMQFLTSGNTLRRRIWRLDDLLLMLLRALAVLALVLALTRPQWHGSTASGGAGREVIFVWDVSMSMGRTQHGQKCFDRLLEKTATLFDQLGPSDRLRGLVTIGPGEWLTTEPLSAGPEQKQQLTAALQRVGVTEAAADWHAVLETALRTPSPSDTHARLVVVLSDGQAEGWRHHDQASWNDLLQGVQNSAVPTAVEIYNVSDTADEAQNLTLESLSMSRQVLGTGESFLVEAEVRNYGTATTEQSTVQWTCGALSLGKTTVGSLEPRQSTKVTLRHTAGNPGFSRISCRIESDDSLIADNERSLMLEIIEHVSVLLVDDLREDDPLRTDRGYVLAALGYGDASANDGRSRSIFQVTTVTPQEFDAEILSQYRAIILPSVPELTAASVARMTDFVRQGGGAWLAPGDQTTPADFNRQFYRNGSGLSPLAIVSAAGDLQKREEFITIHPPAKEHPATLLLSDTQRLDIDRAKVFRHFPFATVTAYARSQIPVLLESGTGEPLAVEGSCGRGRVIVQGLPMGVQWSNLPLTQAWVPLIHEWLWYLIQPSALSLNLRPGEPLIVELPENEHVSRVDVTRPSGLATTLAMGQRGTASIAQTLQTQLPGFYDVSIVVEGTSDQVRRYQVLRSETESRFSPWSPETLAQWSAIDRIRLDPEISLSMPTTSSGQRIGRPLWTLLLLTVVCVLLVELWLAARMAVKRFGFRTEVKEPRPTALRRMLLSMNFRGQH